MTAPALTRTLRGIRRSIGGGRLALACLAAAAPLSAQTSSPEASAAWSWAGALAVGDTLDLRLVRGSIRAETVDGPNAEVTLVRRGVRSAPGSAHAVVKRARGGIRVEDRYPTRYGRRHDECLPPDGARGDFWHSDVRFDAVVRVPRGVRLVAHLMSGDVDVRALAGPRDVSTNDGAVRGAARTP